MSAIQYLHQQVVPAAFALLPMKMASIEAEALLLAICLQESRCVHRRQLSPSGGFGPARGFPQFEIAGVTGVMQHKATRDIVSNLLGRMAYPLSPLEVQPALADNDILAVVFARLLLWTHPAPLPLQGEAAKSWDYYVSLWRPGKPHRATWDAFHLEAWSTVRGGL